MRRERAIFFDLDDTLYPFRRFALSGFAAVAQAVERRFDIPSADAFRTLVACVKAGRRATALQTLCARFGLTPAVIPDLILLIRAHPPRLRLPATTELVLRAMRSRWRTAVVTNGPRDVQARKVSALGLEAIVDDVVYACEYGSGQGKPAPEPFLAALARCELAPDRVVFVGDDPYCDIFGARRAGFRTIRVRGDGSREPIADQRDADRVVASLREVPDAADALVEKAELHVH